MVDVSAAMLVCGGLVSSCDDELLLKGGWQKTLCGRFAEGGDAAFLFGLGSSLLFCLELDHHYSAIYRVSKILMYERSFDTRASSW